jgi:hypothetical protein
MNVQVCLLIVYKLVSSAACPDDTSPKHPLIIPIKGRSFFQPRFVLQAATVLFDQ